MQQRSPNVSREVMETVASELNTDVLELPPLRESIDPDALNTLIRSLSEGQISFGYAGQRITVNSRGEIELANNRYPGEQAADA